MSGRAVLLLGLGVVVSLVDSGCNRGQQSSTAGSGERPLVRVVVVHPHMGGVERTVTRPGSVHAYQYADLYAKVAGYLRNQKVDIGYRVKAGEVLTEIYSPELEKDVARYEADLTKVQAQVGAAEAHVSAAKADLKEAQQKVEQQKSALTSATAMVALRKAQYNRMKGLAEAKAIELELVDEKLQAKLSAEADERESRTKIATAEAGVAAAESKVAAAKADLANAQAAVKVAEATLARAKVIEDYTRIRAPFDAVVTRRTYHDGDFIDDASSNQTQPLYRVARTDRMRVIVDVPDPDVPYARAGALATIHIDSLPGRVFTGKIARTAEAEDYTSRTMRVEVDLPNPDGTLTDGMFGEVTLHMGKTTTGLSIPSECFTGVGKEGKRPVFVVRDGKAQQVEVQVGLDDGVSAEILSGLVATDQVIRTHSPGLTSGSPVQIVPDSSPPPKSSTP